MDIEECPSFQLSLLAQISAISPVAESPQAAAPKVQERTLEKWFEETKQRLEPLEVLIDQAKETGQEPASTIIRQIEILGRIELALTQIASAEDDLEKSTTRRHKEQSELDNFLQAGVPDSEATSILLLDTTRDNLENENRRLVQRKDRIQDASTELDNARNEFKARDSARRLAKEALETNRVDAQQIPLAQTLTESTLFCELSEAIVRLREFELHNARLSREVQEIRVTQLREQANYLAGKAQFDLRQLSAIQQELDQQASQLRMALSEAQGSDTKRKYLEEQWMRTQRQLDAGKGDKELLQEELLAHQLGRRNLDEKSAILQVELDRLDVIRKCWQRRQQIAVGQPTSNDRLFWTEEAEQDLSELASEYRNATTRLEDLRGQLSPIQERLRAADPESPATYWLNQQTDTLQSLIENQEQNLRGIVRCQQLLQKLLSDLSSDSLANSAKQRLLFLGEKANDLWNYELANFEDHPLTIAKVVKAILILIAGFLVAQTLSRWLGKHILKRLDIDASAAATIQSLFYYLLIVLFSLLVLHSINVPLTAFTVLGGAVALGIGFGSQNIINNFISGLILHAERPVKVGDLIQVGQLYGNVEHIGARSTRVRTGDNLDIIVPNSTFLQDTVVNFTLSSDKVRTVVKVGVTYTSDPITVTQLLRRAVVETGRASKEPPPIVLFKNFGESALEFEVHFWIRCRTMMERYQIESAVRFLIVQLFAEENIVFAFPQRDVHFNSTQPIVVQMATPPPTL